jgi:hypothetical protein
MSLSTELQHQDGIPASFGASLIGLVSSIRKVGVHLPLNVPPLFLLSSEWLTGMLLIQLAPQSLSCLSRLSLSLLCSLLTRARLPFTRLGHCLHLLYWMWPHSLRDCVSSLLHLPSGGLPQFSSWSRLVQLGVSGSSSPLCGNPPCVPSPYLSATL